MLIFGTRMYGKKNMVHGWGYCDNCNVYGKQTSYNGRKWGHLYFIPLIPEGPGVRVIKECRNCSHGRHIPETDVPGLLHDLRQRGDRAVAALLGGQTEFDDEGTRKSCAAFLAGCVELLFCLRAEDYVNQILAALREKDLTYAYHLVNGEALEFQGQSEEAARSYQQAAASEPREALPLISLGALYLHQKNHEQAKSFYEQALRLVPDKFPIMHVLLTVYEAVKDYHKLAETYERCFGIVPELAQDKKTLKAYKKACQKAGRQPMFN